MVNPKLKDELNDQLCKAVLKLETIDECYQFFEDICTISELKAMSQRLEVAKMLQTTIDRNEGYFLVVRTQFDSPEVDPEVLVKSDAKLVAGNFYDVKITGAETYDLYGEIAK